MGCLIATAGLLFCAALHIDGLVMLAGGHAASALPRILIPVPIATGVILMVSAIKDTPDPGDEASADLMRKVARLLDATVGYPDEAPAPQVTAPAPADDTSASTERN